MYACNPGLYELLFEGNLGVKFQVLHLELYEILEIKTFSLVLEFKMFFQQQQHSVAFTLLYSDLGGRWDLFFLSYTANVLYVVSTVICLPTKFTNNTK